MKIQLSPTFRIECDPSCWFLIETRMSKPSPKHPAGRAVEKTTYHATVQQAVRSWVEKALRAEETAGTAQHLIAAIARLHARIEEIPEFKRGARTPEEDE